LWRRRESKPEDLRRERSRTGAERREGGESAATDGDETRRRLAKAKNPRASLLALLAEHIAELALVGDIGAARIASDALARLLAAQAPESVITDLSSARGRRDG